MAVLIDLEGIDGSGKGTQAKLLHENLQAAGYRSALLSFPRYQATHFGGRVADFLNGKYGRLKDLHPVLVSLLYAGDRFESRPWLLQQIAEHEVVVLDRYVPSNMAHQGAKLDGEERQDLFRWIEYVEYELYALPRPDLVFWLDVGVEWARQLISRKSARTYTSQVADLQEADHSHLQETHEVYKQISVHGNAWHRVYCLSGENIRPREEIARELWQRTESLLRVRVRN